MSQPWRGVFPDATVLWCLQEARERVGRNSDKGKGSEPWKCCHKTYEDSAEWSCEPEGGFWSQCVITAPASLWSPWLGAGCLLTYESQFTMPWTTEQRPVSAFWTLSDLGVNFFPFVLLRVFWDKLPARIWNSMGLILSLLTPMALGRRINLELEFIPGWKHLVKTGGCCGWNQPGQGSDQDSLTVRYDSDLFV